MTGPALQRGSRRRLANLLDCTSSSKAPSARILHLLCIQTWHMALPLVQARAWLAAAADFDTGPALRPAPSIQLAIGAASFVNPSPAMAFVNCSKKLRFNLAHSRFG